MVNIIERDKQIITFSMARFYPVEIFMTKESIKISDAILMLLKENGVGDDFIRSLISNSYLEKTLFKIISKFDRALALQMLNDWNLAMRRLLMKWTGVNFPILVVGKISKFNFNFANLDIRSNYSNKLALVRILAMISGYKHYNPKYKRYSKAPQTNFGLIDNIFSILVDLSSNETGLLKLVEIVRKVYRFGYYENRRLVYYTDYPEATQDIIFLLLDIYKTYRAKLNSVMKFYRAIGHLLSNSTIPERVAEYSNGPVDKYMEFLAKTLDNKVNPGIKNTYISSLSNSRYLLYITVDHDKTFIIPDNMNNLAMEFGFER